LQRRPKKAFCTASDRPHERCRLTIAPEKRGRSMKPRPYTVTEIKDFALSADGTQATFTLVAKYAGEMAVTMPVSCLDALKLPQNPAPAGVKGKSGETRKGTLHRPKKWLLGGETTEHKIVALIFDPQSDRETGFAFSPKSAKDLAAGLVRSADAVSTYKPPRPN
jgi:hypothetical protein